MSEITYTLSLRYWRNGRNTFVTSTHGSKGEMYSTLGANLSRGGVEGWNCTVRCMRCDGVQGSIFEDFSAGSDWHPGARCK